MNGIDLLKEDHQKVKALFREIESGEGGNDWELFKKIKTELEIHTHIEETVLYPKMKEAEELLEIVLEGIEEHHQANLMLREISGLTGESDKFEPKIKVLIENVEHHIREEEREMFPKIEELYDERFLEQIGGELEAARRDFKKSIAAAS